MSSSRVDAVGLLGAALVCTACATAAAPPPPDAPRPARTPALAGQTPRAAAAVAVPERPVEIRSARVRALRGDSLLALVGRHRLEQSRDAVVIEVVTVEPLGNVARSSSPEIYVNGERVAETWPRPPDRLYGVLPDRERLRGRVEITVAWLGREAQTRSQRPVVLQDGERVP